MSNLTKEKRKSARSQKMRHRRLMLDHQKNQIQKLFKLQQSHRSVPKGKHRRIFLVPVSMLRLTEEELKENNLVEGQQLSIPVVVDTFIPVPGLTSTEQKQQRNKYYKNIKDEVVEQYRHKLTNAIVELPEYDPEGSSIDYDSLTTAGTE